MALMLLLTSAIHAAGQEYSRDDLVFQPQVFEYGSIGIDYSVHHDFHLINQGRMPVRILDTEIDCDCTTLRLSDSVAAPGDTIVLKTKLKTSNLYGPTGKSVIVVTDHPLLERIEYRFPAEVGQWSQGFKPLPLGLMFLPGAKPQEVRIWNRHFPRATMEIADQYDSTFTVELVKASVAKGEMLTLSVSPNKDLPPGTHTSNFTLSIVREGKETPVRLTIPVKAVKY
jgi:hypothetical protein